MGPVSSIYDILKRPLITEKSASIGAESNAVVFEVHSSATKQDVKKAVEKIFDVQVENVRTINVPRKVKGRGQPACARVQTWKKAYVMLKPGSSLNVIEGL